MKKNHTIFALSLCLGLLITAIFGFTNKSDTNSFLIIRVIECKGGDSGNKSVIYISNEDGEISEIELMPFNKKNFKSNFQKISQVLNEQRQKGYHLISSSGSGGDDNGMMLQNYIFEKR